MVDSEVHLDDTTQKNVSSWLAGDYDDDSKNEIKKLLKVNPQSIIDAFYTHLSFGTGGLRGLMGIGTNRMNQYTVGSATQGLANYINKQPKTYAHHSVLVGYDSRNNSRFFSEIAAKIFAANDIKVYMYNEMRPVPLVSFGCRYKHCTSAIMITASHNPPEYNGYKVYWSDGAQVLPPNDIGIINEVKLITDIKLIKQVDQFSHPLIEIVYDEIDKAYLAAIHNLQHYPDANRADGPNLNIIYTPLHGAGLTMVPKALPLWGFTTFKLVEKQAIPDGNFPTVKKPNPEEQEALQMGIDLMIKNRADILLGTDPDSDRIGVAIMHEGKATLLSGNETACLCLNHICKAMTKQNNLPKDAGFAKTIVTSELLPSIAKAYGKVCGNVLTGFKYIGQLIKNWEDSSDGKQFLFGGEESYGYLLGTHARDKDAVVMAPLICEIALQAKLKGLTLLDFLYEIYEEYGIYQERLYSKVYEESKETKDKIQKIIENLRTSPPKAFANIPIRSVEDYQTSMKFDFQTNNKERLTLPQSNVLLFWLDDESKLVIRPSGTEPKIKLYCGVVNKTFTSIPAGIKDADRRIDRLLKDLETYLV